MKLYEISTYTTKTKKMTITKNLFIQYNAPQFLIEEMQSFGLEKWEIIDFQSLIQHRYHRILANILYDLGLHCIVDDEQYIREALIEMDNANSIYRACLNWPDSIYDKRLIDALIDTKNDIKIVYTAIEISKERYEDKLLYAILDGGKEDRIMKLYRNLPRQRYNHEKIIEWICKKGKK